MLRAEPVFTFLDKNKVKCRTSIGLRNIVYQSPFQQIEDGQELLSYQSLELDETAEDVLFSRQTDYILTIGTGQWNSFIRSLTQLIPMSYLPADISGKYNNLVIPEKIAKPKEVVEIKVDCFLYGLLGKSRIWIDGMKSHINSYFKKTLEGDPNLITSQIGWERDKIKEVLLSQDTPKAVVPILIQYLQKHSRDKEYLESALEAMEISPESQIQGLWHKFLSLQ
ncbi:MAG: hypothetical protein LBP88_00475 [Treponema sp.]|jgi:hypothetical protein|nr:hypothetical protein [Treponema sp.]